MVSDRELKDPTHGLARLHVIPAQRPAVVMRHLRARSCVLDSVQWPSSPTHARVTQVSSSSVRRPRGLGRRCVMRPQVAGAGSWR